MVCCQRYTLCHDLQVVHSEDLPADMLLARRRSQETLLHQKRVHMVAKLMEVGLKHIES